MIIQPIAGASLAAAQQGGAANATAAPTAPVPARPQAAGSQPSREDARQFSELMASPRTVLQAPQTVSTMVNSAVSRALSGLNVHAADSAPGELHQAMAGDDTILNDRVTADLFRTSTEKMTHLMVTTSIASAGTSTFKSVLHNNE